VKVAFLSVLAAFLLSFLLFFGSNGGGSNGREIYKIEKYFSPLPKNFFGSAGSCV